ncbi:RQC domain-containing protein [Nitrosomonas sp. Nm58]|uniref:RQC domain-containing protein n=1 Tax=Nitrosomonas sp. Nm58 TaxID=200126 RepID=UPI000B865F65|nr:RQC domain-containing protein [Nitrosomonas sp. Nm58]
MCEATTCCRARLLDYFGETMADVTCGNCDICHHPPAVWDGTIVAQKALPCANRSGQHFNTEHLIYVLHRESYIESVRQQKYDKISTFGIGKELNEREWHAVFQQLTANSSWISCLGQPRPSLASPYPCLSCCIERRANYSAVTFFQT